MHGLALLVLSILPHGPPVVREEVTLIERNHYYDECGRHVFTQWIFWEWKDTRHEVIAWRLDKPDFRFQERPPCLRMDEGRVDAECWRETWTQYDPELMERERFPKEYRKGIFGER